MSGEEVGGVEEEWNRFKEVILNVETEVVGMRRINKEREERETHVEMRNWKDG